MKLRPHRITRPSVLAAALLLCGASQAGAGDWKWSVTPYAWATDVGVDVKLDDRQVVDQEIAFEDLLEDLEAVAQVHVEAQRGSHGVMLDLFDVQLAEDGSRVALPVAAGAEAVLSSEIGMTILELGGIYDPRGDRQGFALLYGTRILQQRADIDARFELAPPPPSSAATRSRTPSSTASSGCATSSASRPAGATRCAPTSAPAAPSSPGAPARRFPTPSAKAGAMRPSPATGAWWSTSTPRIRPTLT